MVERAIEEHAERSHRAAETRGETLQGPQHRGVSIVVPAFNEEDGIGPQIERLQQVMDRSGWTYELIVVDDGSTDRTAEVIQRYQVHLIQLPRNRGYGFALKVGIAAAKQDWILITDADGTYPVDVIPEMLSHMDEYEMVVAARTGQDVQIPLIRRPSKWVLGCLASYLAEQPIPDLNSGLRVFRKSLVDQFGHLLPSGFSFTTTITMAVLSSDYRILYIPIDYHKRIGHSKIRASHAYQFLLIILRMAVYFNPLRVFLPLGAIFFLVGLAKLVYDFYLWNLSESAVMFILTAVILWAVGLLADQISRIALAQKSK
jgi:glycosyltransferase involved in cell wall biosynthesis